MKIKNLQTVSNAIKKGRKMQKHSQKLTQEEAAKIIGVSRTTLSMMETNGDALGSASFFSVLKAIKLAGLELHLTERSMPPTLNDIQEINAGKIRERIKAEDQGDAEEENDFRP